MSEIINYSISATIMIIASIILGIIVLEQKEFKLTKEKIIIILIGIIAYSMATRNFTWTTKTLILGIINTILYTKLLKISYSNAIFLTFMYIILTIIPDIILLIFLVVVLKISPEVCDVQYTTTLWATIIVSILLLLIVYIFRKLLRKLIKIRINNDKLVIVYTILTLGCILIIFYTTVKNILIKENLISGILIMLIFAVILYSLIKQKMENDKIVEKYDKLLEFIKNMK